MRHPRHPAPGLDRCRSTRPWRTTPGSTTTCSALDGLTDVADRRIQQKVVYRTREQVARFLDGTDLVEPGLVRMEEWRPERGTDEKGQSSGWCAVGRKR